MSRQKKCPRGCGSFLLTTMVRLNTRAKKRSLKPVRLLYCPEDDLIFDLFYHELVDLGKIYNIFPDSPKHPIIENKVDPSIKKANIASKSPPVASSSQLPKKTKPLKPFQKTQATLVLTKPYKKNKRVNKNNHPMKITRIFKSKKEANSVLIKHFNH